MPDLRKYLVLANLTERMFVWTPPKTGSTTAVGILSKLGFLPYSISGKYLIPTSEEPHNHNCTFYEGHEKYSFITSMRNPYTVMASMFIQSVDEENVSQEKFNFFVNSYFYGEKNEGTYHECYDYQIRTPDYIIRVESMFEDYLKLPFVRTTEYFKSGELSKDCLSKKNPSHLSNFDWKKLYDQNIADIVYYNSAHIFDLGEYSKNSWK